MMKWKDYSITTKYTECNLAKYTYAQTETRSIHILGAQDGT